jgi:hypothetical protein
MVGEDAMGNRRTQAQEDAYVASLSKKPDSRMSPSLNYAPMRRGMKFGGSVKKSEMGMKKGGMPPAAMAAMMARRPRMGAGMPPSAPPVMPPQPPMGMKKGGIAKYAGGGGIESRGKTKGTVIRMASGGSVDGIAQRGKTRGKMC